MEKVSHNRALWSVCTFSKLLEHCVCKCRVVWVHSVKSLLSIFSDYLSSVFSFFSLFLSLFLRCYFLSCAWWLSHFFTVLFFCNFKRHFLVYLRIAIGCQIPVVDWTEPIIPKPSVQFGILSTGKNWKFNSSEKCF